MTPTPAIPVPIPPDPTPEPPPPGDTWVVRYSGFHLVYTTAETSLETAIESAHRLQSEGKRHVRIFMLPGGGGE